MVDIEMAEAYPVVNGNGVGSATGSLENLFLTPELEDIVGEKYVMAAVLAEQVSYSLSGTIFEYADGLPEEESPVTYWSKGGNTNASGAVPSIVQLETRSGAGIYVLGHSSSSDATVYPDSVFASSATVGAMQPVLSQLASRYHTFKPVVAHVAAIDVDYTANFVTDYVTPLRTAREAGVAAIISTSADEVQYISVLASLFATVMPTLHICDGVRLARELTKVDNILSVALIKNLYDTVRQSIPSTTKADPIPQLTNLLASFNNAVGAHFSFFGYVGHPEPETVLVVLGSTEASLANAVASTLAQHSSVGVVHVRIYQPFSDADFLVTLPKTTRRIAVLGQIGPFDTRSILYEDVLAAVASTGTPVEILDIKYTQQNWSKAHFGWIFQQLSTGAKEISLTLPEAHERFDEVGAKYVFWDLDDSVSSTTARKVAQHFASDPALTISFNETYDNFSQAGTLYSELRTVGAGRKVSVGQIESADVVVVGNLSVAKSFNVVDRVAPAGKLLLMATVKPENLEKKLPLSLRKSIYSRRDDIEVYNINPKDVGQVGDGDIAENSVLELVFLKLINQEPDISRLAKESCPSGVGYDQVLQGLVKIMENINTSLVRLEIPATWADLEDSPVLPSIPRANSYTANPHKTPVEPEAKQSTWHTAAQQIMFKESHSFQNVLRPELPMKNWIVTVQENKRLTPLSYDRNIFHIEFDLSGTDLTYSIGEALGIHGQNDAAQVDAFINWYGLDPEAVISIPAKEYPGYFETKTIRQLFRQTLDIFGRPPKKFYEMLSVFATDEKQKMRLLALGGPEGATEFKRRAEVETLTFADILEEFPSAKPSLADLIRLIPAIKRREYSIASSQKAHPTSVHLLIVEVEWRDEKNRDRYGQATRYLSQLAVGSKVTVSVKPSVMKLPQDDMTPIIMAGLGTGLAPFRAFVQERAWQRSMGREIGPVFLYMGSRHQREEYLYGEEWEAYRDAGVITLLGQAFSRDQPQKVYIQDVMKNTLVDIIDALIAKRGSFYLCGPTWPVPDVTRVLQDAIEEDAKAAERTKVDSRREIEALKDDGRYVLEVY